MPEVVDMEPCPGGRFCWRTGIFGEGVKERGKGHVRKRIRRAGAG